MPEGELLMYIVVVVTIILTVLVLALLDKVTI